MAKSSSKSRFIRDRLDSIRVVDPSPDHSKVTKTRFGHQSKIILKVSFIEDIEEVYLFSLLAITKQYDPLERGGGQLINIHD